MAALCLQPQTVGVNSPTSQIKLKEEMCHVQRRISADTQRQLDTRFPHTHTHTHLALRCLESRDRTVSFSLPTAPNQSVNTRKTGAVSDLRPSRLPAAGLHSSIHTPRLPTSYFSAPVLDSFSSFSSLISAVGLNSSHICFLFSF